MTNRVFSFLYGAISYIFFFATFLYAIGFIGNFAVRKSMDSVSVSTWPAALLVDLGLLALFAVQHSVMARPAFKRAVAPGFFPPQSSAVPTFSPVALPSCSCSGNGSRWEGASGTFRMRSAGGCSMGASHLVGSWCSPLLLRSTTSTCSACGRFGGISWGSHRRICGLKYLFSIGSSGTRFTWAGSSHSGARQT